VCTGPLPGRRYVLLRIALVLLGPIFYMAQLRANVLRVPWYAPVLATVGSVLLLVAVAKRPTVWRIAGLVFGLLLAAGQWSFLLSLSKLPTYTGPVVEGASLPAFTTILADGSTFDQDLLRGEHNTVLLCFRGLW